MRLLVPLVVARNLGQGSIMSIGLPIHGGHLCGRGSLVALHVWIGCRGVRIGLRMQFLAWEFLFWWPNLEIPVGIVNQGGSRGWCNGLLVGEWRGPGCSWSRRFP